MQNFSAAKSSIVPLLIGCHILLYLSHDSHLVQSTWGWEANKKEAEIFSKKLVKVEIRLIRAASDSGQLYGSVTSRDIVNFLNEKNLQINKNQVILNKSLKNASLESFERLNFK